MILIHGKGRKETSNRALEEGEHRPKTSGRRNRPKEDILNQASQTGASFEQQRGDIAPARASPDRFKQDIDLLNTFILALQTPHPLALPKAGS